MRKRELFALLFATLLFCLACRPDMDRKDLERLEQVAVSLNSSLQTGITCLQFEKVLQHFSSEISTTEKKATSRKDREMLKAFADLAAIYQDGLILWKYKLEFSPFDFVPQGRIYVGQDAEAVVSKYRLVTETHLYEPTQKHWKSVSEGSIGLIWENAATQLQIIKNLIRE